MFVVAGNLKNLFLTYVFDLLFSLHNSQPFFSASLINEASSGIAYILAGREEYYNLLSPL